MLILLGLCLLFNLVADDLVKIETTYNKVKTKFEKPKYIIDQFEVIRNIIEVSGDSDEVYPLDINPIYLKKLFEIAEVKYDARNENADEYKKKIKEKIASIEHNNILGILEAADFLDFSEINFITEKAAAELGKTKLKELDKLSDNIQKRILIDWLMLNRNKLANKWGCPIHGKKINELRSDKNCDSVAISQDIVVAGGKDYHIYYWNITHNQHLKLQGNRLRINSVAISKDAKTVVAGSSDKKIYIWTENQPHVLLPYVLNYGKASVESVAVSGDGKRIVSGSYDREVVIWDFENHTWREKYSFEEHNSSVKAVAISADGLTVVSGSTDKKVIVKRWVDNSWNSVNLQSNDSVLSVDISEDGKTVVAAGSGSDIYIWRLENNEWLVKHKLKNSHNPVYSVSLSRDCSRIVASTFNNQVVIWSWGDGLGADAGKKVWSKTYLPRFATEQRSVAISKDGSKIVSAGGTFITLWDYVTLQECKINLFVAYALSKPVLNAEDKIFLRDKIDLDDLYPTIKQKLLAKGLRRRHREE